MRRTDHNRRQLTHTTDADSSGSFLRRTRQTLNASKSVRNRTPNRGEVDRYVSLAASPSRRSYHGRVLFSARTVLFLVDPEKSCLGGMLPQGGIDAEMRRTDHNRWQHTHTTDADSSGSFLRRTRHTLNASKGVRNWTPNRGEVGRYVCLRPRARAAVRTTGAYFSRLAPCCSLWTPKSRVWALR